MPRAVVVLAMAAAVLACVAGATAWSSCAWADVGDEISPGAATAASAKLSAKEVSKAVVADAKVVIKKAKATKGQPRAKLKKIYAYIAKDQTLGGTYLSDGSVINMWMINPDYYDPSLQKMKNSLVKKHYKRYAIDMFNERRGSCYNYAALFAVAAKQALGSSATVKIAVGPSVHTGILTEYHSWTEVKLGKKTYVYDPQAGNNAAKNAGSATSFGKFCGTEKAKLKANYKNYKGVKYVTVKL